MKTTTASLLAAAIAATAVEAVPIVDTTYPYTGPKVPVADWVDPTINGNGKGFIRLVEPPAVTPKSPKPRNNINVISFSYLPDNGMNIHYQTPFGLGVAPEVRYGTDPNKLYHVAKGYTHTYKRTPSCSEVIAVTQCSEFFHEVPLHNLRSGTTYYYQIPAANGTTASDIMAFTTAQAAGESKEFSVAVLNDMGYTNAGGTWKQIIKAVDEGTAFAWHGGDISYADDWFSGILPCADWWTVCSNGTSSTFPGEPNPEYLKPLPAGEIPNQGTPRGGDLSVLYESSWDLWQQWMGNITTKVPYMVLPGNHEAACAEFDGTGYPLTAYLDDNEMNSTTTQYIDYYSCPPSQRNFTAYQHRFRMPGAESKGVGNFWYSFDYGLAHFISIDGETDFANSPESPLEKHITGNETHPARNETTPIDSGPFGDVNGSLDDNKSYEQLKWLKKDLASIDRTKTPWVFAMSHRPMYSTEVDSYQVDIRNAFEELLLEYGVDAYFSGHIHWYERLYPLGQNGTIDTASIINENTYRTNPGKSMTHIINGQAGNLENHSTPADGEELLDFTALLDDQHFGFSKLTVINATTAKWEFIRGDNGAIGDHLWIVKPESEFPGHSNHGKASNNHSKQPEVHSKSTEIHGERPKEHGKGDGRN